MLSVISKKSLIKELRVDSTPSVLLNIPRSFNKMKSSNFFFSVFGIIIAISIGNVGSQVDSDFAVTFEGFFPLVDRDYRLKCVKSDFFRKQISLSMYRYYMAQHLYARLALIRQSRNISDSNEQQFVKLVYSTSPLLPRPIFEYLRSIGDIPENGADGLKYAFLMWPNQEGHFGRVDATNHWKYMSFPAPFIVAQAIQEDYFFTLNESTLHDAIWTLRQDLIPEDIADRNRTDCRSPGYPTQNLLGWKPFTELTLQQRQILQSSLITNRIFDTADSKFYVNPTLLDYIYIIFREQSNLFDFNEVTPIKYRNIIFGRQLQLGWLLPLYERDASFSRMTVHTDRGTVGYKIMSSERDESERVLTMAFRVMKSAVVPTWSIFDWSNYQCVPHDWIETRNTVFFFENSYKPVVKILSSLDKVAVRRNFLDDRQ